MNPEEKERARVCNNLAFDCYQLLDPKVKEIANTLNNGMEIDSFLASLNNRLAIIIHTNFNIKNSSEK